MGVTLHSQMHTHLGLRVPLEGFPLKSSHKLFYQEERIDSKEVNFQDLDDVGAEEEPQHLYERKDSELIRDVAQDVQTASLTQLHHEKY